MDEAEHVVLAAADHRVARVRRVRRRLGRPADGERRVEEDDLGARHHHLADRALAGREHVVDQPALVGGQRLVRGDQAAQLLLADRLATGARVAAEQPHHDVGRLRQQPDDRTEERRRCGSAAARTASPRPRCAAAPSRLGASSPSTSVTKEMISVTPMMPVAAGQPVAPAVADRGAFLASSGQRHRAERARQQRGRRDADLDGGQEAVRVAGQPGDRRAAATAGLGRARGPGPRAGRPARSRPRRTRPR